MALGMSLVAALVVACLLVEKRHASQPQLQWRPTPTEMLLEFKLDARRTPMQPWSADLRRQLFRGGLDG